MGPRFDERGNRADRGEDGPAPPRLQWGRASMSAETGRCNPEEEQERWLQWGRASMSAETKSGSVCIQEPHASLQWGRASMSAETVPSVRHRRVLREPASMGPRFDERGNMIQAGSTPGYPGVLQWGRASMSAETRPRD